MPEETNEFGLPPMVLRYEPQYVSPGVVIPSRWVLVLNGVDVAELDVSYYHFVDAWCKTDMRRFTVEGI